MDSNLLPIRRLVPVLAALLLLACGILAAPAAAAPGEASPTAVAFGSETVGEKTPGQFVTITNLEPISVHIVAVSIGGADPGDFAIGAETCAAALLAYGESCVVELTFSPQAGGLREATLVASRAGELPVVVPLSGTGQTKKLTVPGATAYPTTTVGDFVSEKILLKNSSEADVFVSEVKIEGADAGDFAIEGNDCAGSIGIGMSCELSVRFTPGAAGARAATLRVSTDGIPTATYVTLSGEGARPEVVFEPGGYDFGPVEVHSGTPRAGFSLRNEGAAAVQLSNLEITGPGADEFSIPAGGCSGTTLAPGATCAIEVQFQANREGNFTAALSVKVGSANFEAPLSAEAARPRVTASPDPLAFGPTAVGSRQVSEATLTNTGRLPVGFYIAFVSGGDVASFHLVDETCTSNAFAGTPRILEPGESCRVKIAFEPTEAGAEHAIVSVFGAGEGALQFSVEGTAVAPQLTFMPATRDFGAVAVGDVGAPQTFQLRNESAGPQAIETVSLGGGNVGEFQLRADECSGATLDPDATCAISVRFAPESGGAKSATLRLRGPGGTTVGRLNGEGTEVGAAAAVGAATTPGGRVSLTLRPRSRSGGGKVTIGRARCESTEPCTLRIGGLASGRIATASGLRPGLRRVTPIHLTLAPGTSAPLDAFLPREFRGIGPARLSVTLQWRTGAQHGGSRHSFLLSGRLAAQA